MRHRVLENGLTKTELDHLRSNSNSENKLWKYFPNYCKETTNFITVNN